MRNSPERFFRRLRNAASIALVAGIALHPSITPTVNAETQPIVGREPQLPPIPRRYSQRLFPFYPDNARLNKTISYHLQIKDRSPNEAMFQVGGSCHDGIPEVGVHVLPPLGYRITEGSVELPAPWPAAALIRRGEEYNGGAGILDAYTTQKGPVEVVARITTTSLKNPTDIRTYEITRQVVACAA